MPRDRGETLEAQENMERAKRYGWFSLVGAASYWGTDALIQLMHPPHRIWILLLTFGVPIVVGVVWYQLFRKAHYENYPKAFPLLMLLGIWALGPPAMAITMQFLGGTFLDIEKLQGFLMVWAAFPATTFMMSIYSGSLGGLLISTILLLIMSLVASSKQRAYNKRLQVDAAAPRD